MADGEGGGESNVNQVKPESQAIGIVVRDQTGNEVHFKIKNTTKFEKVFNAYCEKKAVDARSVKFLFDGQRVDGTHTPATHGMEDNDVIDCMIEQLGGSC